MGVVMVVVFSTLIRPAVRPTAVRISTTNNDDHHLDCSLSLSAELSQSSSRDPAFLIDGCVGEEGEELAIVSPSPKAPTNILAYSAPHGQHRNGRRVLLLEQKTFRKKRWEPTLPQPGRSMDDGNEGASKTAQTKRVLQLIDDDDSSGDDDDDESTYHASDSASDDDDEEEEEEANIRSRRKAGKKMKTRPKYVKASAGSKRRRKAFS